VFALQLDFNGLSLVLDRLVAVLGTDSYLFCEYTKKYMVDEFMVHESFNLLDKKVFQERLRVFQALFGWVKNDKGVSAYGLKTRKISADGLDKDHMALLLDYVRVCRYKKS
jgi:hypothetical protein